MTWAGSSQLNGCGPGFLQYFWRFDHGWKCFWTNQLPLLACRGFTPSSATTELQDVFSEPQKCTMCSEGWKCVLAGSTILWGQLTQLDLGLGALLSKWCFCWTSLHTFFSDDRLISVGAHFPSFSNLLASHTASHRHLMTSYPNFETFCSPSTLPSSQKEMLSCPSRTHVVPCVMTLSLTLCFLSDHPPQPFFHHIP